MRISLGAKLDSSESPALYPITSDLFFFIIDQLKKTLKFAIILNIALFRKLNHKADATLVFRNIFLPPKIIFVIIKMLFEPYCSVPGRLKLYGLNSKMSENFETPDV